MAVGDLDVRLAFPHGVITRKTFAQDVTDVLEAMEEWEATQVVIGDPLRTDGRAMGDVPSRRLAGALREKGISPILWDERYSTKAAERLLAHVDGRKRRTQCVDAAAAQWILQGYLDSLVHQDRRAHVEED